MNLLRFIKIVAALLAILPLLCSASNIIKKPTERECLQYMAYREASGEPIETIVETIHVVKRRASINSATICETIKKPFQFPYVRYGVKKVTDKKFLQKYYKAVTMKSQLSNSYIFFNHKKHKWGKNTRKFGKMYFQTN